MANDAVTPSTVGPLHGIRVLDFGWAWAGPYGATMLAFMGAEVLKIESAQRADYSRRMSMTTRESFTNLDESTVFNDINPGKRSVCLNLTDPRAVEIVRRLVKVSDIVMGNMRPGVMDKLGLGYADLKAIQPDIVLAWSSACGAYGPEQGYVGYAPTFAALGGISFLTAHPGGPPTMLTGSIDTGSGTTFALAALIALNHRLRTGEGQFLDLSSREAITVLTGHALVDYALNGHVQGPQGNDDQVMAPHNVYPCRDADTWVSIAVGTHEAWRALCDLVGSGLETDPRFGDAAGRRAHRGELDEELSAWTRQRTPKEAASLLQAAGVAAAPSATDRDLWEDDHLQARGVYQTITHPVIGERVMVGPPWKFSETPAVLEAAAPLLGEHTRDVLGDLLGMGPAQIDHLVAERVLI